MATEMKRSTLDSWTSQSSGDLRTEVVEDVPVKGESVLVRGLPAAYSNQASSEALELKTVGREQIATVNTARMEILQFAHGVVEPKFTVEQAEDIAQRFGPGWRKVINAIDSLSGVDKAAIEAAQARFPRSGASENGQSDSDADPAGNGDR